MFTAPASGIAPERSDLCPVFLHGAGRLVIAARSAATEVTAATAEAVGRRRRVAGTAAVEDAAKAGIERGQRARRRVRNRGGRLRIATPTQFALSCLELFERLAGKLVGLGTHGSLRRNRSR